ncbi:MAG: M20/M25/M40 family metallo-hydrolase [Bacteroidales bacterium]|nr:M20/M25/M40 family metallo-hydrolase [Bacteroidales bacterium]
MEQHVYTLAADSLQGRKAGTEYAQKAAAYIVKQFALIGIEPFGDTLFLQRFNDDMYRNVVGIIHGNDSILKNEYIIVGAHYDHLGVRNGDVYNGADDNASGVATLIELARKLKNDQSNLKRSVILIAFDAEEIGLIGSTYFINHTEIPIENIKLMMSLDMVGWYKESGKVEYIGSGTIKGGKKIIENSQLVPEGLNVVAKKFETHIFAGTDTHPFAQKGIPTLAVSTGMKSPYHKPEDEAHLIDYDGMALITEHLKNLVEAVANDPDFKSSGRVAKKHRLNQKFEFGVSVNTGTNRHHYTAGAVTGKSTFSYGIGLMSQVNFGNFAIRPEVYYDKARAKYPAGTIATDNLTVPLSIVLKTAQQQAGADLFLGGYYTYRFDGKQGKEKIDFEHTFNRQEVGLTYGFSLYVKPFKIGFTGRRALTNFSQSSNANHAHLRNRAGYFTITYLF